MRQIILDLTKKTQQIEITEDTEIIGLFLGYSQEICEFKLDVIHKKPHLKSNTLVKAVIFDQARFDMVGNLIIQTGAKFTDSYLRIDCLLMSDDAFARAVPSLEITEDDVKGGHGATVGQVNQEQLFYLQSRGLSNKEAEAILVEGFIHEIYEKAPELKRLHVNTF